MPFGTASIMPVTKRIRTPAVTRPRSHGNATDTILMAVLTSTAACGGLAQGTRDGGTDGRADVASEAASTAQEQWIDFCLVITACGLYVNASPPLNLMTQCAADARGQVVGPDYAPWVDPAWQACVLAAGTSCDKAAACANGGSSDDSCEASTPSPSCKGSLGQYCDGQRQWSYDCSMLGGVCTPSLGCTSGQSCAAGPADYASCQGENVGLCSVNAADGGTEGHFVVGVFCGNVGGSSCGKYACQHCEEGVLEPGCVGLGPACTTDRCDGATLVSCVGGHEARTDCTPSGLECVSRKDSKFDFATAEFCAQGTECNTSAFCGLGTECGYDYADSCKGNVLTYCDVGKITTLDCVAAGWKSCVSDKLGTRCSE
jgi:hypothetical protein